MISTKPCSGCRMSAIRGLVIHGPVLGVRLVQACPDCRIFRSDAEAVRLASATLDIPAIEQAGRCYLDELGKSVVEPLIVQDLEIRRERALAAVNV